MTSGQYASGWGQTNGSHPQVSANAPRSKRYRAKLDTIGDVKHELCRLFRDARSGTLDVQAASRLANILAIVGRVIEGSDLEARLTALEGKDGQ